jgi:dihydroflavonol-4-reductase
MILVTGGCGFLGAGLVKSLLESGYNVRVLDLDETRIRREFPRAEAFKADITDPRTLQGCAADVDTVIHLAGIVSYSKPKDVIYKINATGTENLLSRCEEVKKFILSSSVSVYGRIKGIADENCMPAPINAYGYSKLKAEEAVKNSGLPSIIFRTAPVYGVGSPSWLKNLKLLDKGFPVPDTGNLTHVVHVNDVLQAFELAVEGPAGTFNIADERPMRFTDFADYLVRSLGKNPRHVPLWTAKLLATVTGNGKYMDVLTMNRYYSIARAKEQLKFQPKAVFQEEVIKMIEWYKSNR